MADSSDVTGLPQKISRMRDVPGYVAHPSSAALSTGLNSVLKTDTKLEPPTEEQLDEYHAIVAEVLNVIADRQPAFLCILATGAIPLGLAVARRNQLYGERPADFFHLLPGYRWAGGPPGEDKRWSDYLCEELSALCHDAHSLGASILLLDTTSSGESAFDAITRALQRVANDIEFGIHVDVMLIANKRHATTVGPHRIRIACGNGAYGIKSVIAHPTTEPRDREWVGFDIEDADRLRLNVRFAGINNLFSEDRSALLGASQLNYDIGGNQPTQRGDLPVLNSEGVQVSALASGGSLSIAFINTMAENDDAPVWQRIHGNTNQDDEYTSDLISEGSACLTSRDNEVFVLQLLDAKIDENNVTGRLTIAATSEGRANDVLRLWQENGEGGWSLLQIDVWFDDEQGLRWILDEPLIIIRPGDFIGDTHTETSIDFAVRRPIGGESNDIL